MTDLIERLRSAKANGNPEHYLAGVSVAVAHEAAALIERQCALLKDIEWVCLDHDDCCPSCGGQKHRGHALDCELSSLIGEA